MTRRANGRATIRAQGLTMRFGDFTAVEDVSFQVQAGEIFGFLGPNGSGKTTTIRMTLGLLAPTAGEVEVLGVPVVREPAAIRGRVGYMAQRFSLYNDLTVAQNLRFYGQAYGLAAEDLREALARALELSGLTGREGAKTSELAGGWRQRLALSAAILHRPEVVFLDEPTAGVDPVSRREFWELLYRLAEDGVTVFVTTHYMDEAEHCHRLAFLQRGTLIAMGSPDAIRREGIQGRLLQVQCEDLPGALAALRGAAQSEAAIEHVEVYGSTLHVLVGKGPGTQRRLKRRLEEAGIRGIAIERIEPSLEDVFIESMR